MTRKRAPGGGRKPKGAAPMRSQVNVRMPDDLRAELEAAARKRSRNVSEELLARLRASFARERELKRDPASRALNYAISEIASGYAKMHSRYRDHPKRPWTRDAFLFRSFKIAVARFLDRLVGPLDALNPPGELQSSNRDPNDPLPFDTPESLAKIASYAVFFNLFQLWPTPTPEEYVAMGDESRNRWEDTLYATSDARRDLGFETPSVDALLKFLKNGD